MNDYESSGQESSGLTHEEIVEMLPAFVVGALDPDEMLAVEDYLHAHPALMAQVDELELSFAKLAYAAPPQHLPRELHAKVMQRAQASLPPRPQTTTARAPAPRPLAPAPRENWLARWWRKRAFFDLGMIAAVAALIALAVLYRGALVQIDDLRQQVAGLQAQVATIETQNSDLQNENIRLQSELDTRVDQLASIGSAQQVVTLGGTDVAPGASGTLFVQENTGTLVLRDLDELAADQTYQLWLIPAEGAPVPAGLLGQAGPGVQTISLALPTTLEGMAAVGISVEPPGGSAAPSGPIVLLGETA